MWSHYKTIYLVNSNDDVVRRDMYNILFKFHLQKLQALKTFLDK